MPENNTFKITLTAQQLDIIGKLLGEAPYRIVAPIVQTINQQIEQQTMAAAAIQNDATD